MLAAIVGPSINITRSADSENETAIVIDPTNPQRLFAESNLSFAPNGVMGAFSTDGGATWTTRIIGGGNDGFPAACCDPTMSWDRFGNLFVGYLAFGATSNEVIVLRSTDGGQTFTLVNQMDIDDQPTITTGPSGDPDFDSLWVTAERGGQVIVAGARVNGLGSSGAFSAPVAVPNSGGNFGDIAVGPNGEVMVTWQEPTGGEGPAEVFISVDADGLGPGTFTPAASVAQINVGGFDFIPAQSGRSVDAEAGLAWDRTRGPSEGRVYLMYTDESPAESNNTDIFVRFSDNLGATWSTPVKANDDATTNSQFNPKIALDQTSGAIAVTFYDSRNDQGAGGPGDTNGIPNDDAQVWGTFSTDGGLTFEPNFQISAGTSNAATSSSTIDYGDFSGLAFDNGVFYPIWADNSPNLPGNPALPNFDIATAQVSVATTLSIADVTASEPATGATNFAFAVTLSRAVPAPITVQFTTSDGTAIAGADYTSVRGTLTFSPGSTVQTILVPVIGDLQSEPPETFLVTLSNAVGAVLGTSVGTGTILNPKIPPVAVPDEIVVTEDAALVRIGILANDSDLDGRLDPASVVFTSQPGLGTITYNPSTGVVLYTATPNSVGADSFTYHVSDNEGLVSNEASVTVTILGFNDPPIAFDDFAKTEVGLPVNIAVLSNDRDVDGLLAFGSLGVSGAPLHGTAHVETNGTITYIPFAGYSGGDSFTYGVQDNAGATAFGSVAIQIGRPITIGGFVYADVNNNGRKDANEIGIPNVNITVLKNDAPFITMNVVTGVDGSYLFTDSGTNLLPGGSYSIVETHPGFFADGQDTAGTPAPASIQNDQFINLTVPSGGAATNFLFGERGLRVEFINAYLDRRAFYASSVNTLSGINLQLGDVWFAFDNGIAGQLAANSSFDGSQGGAAITLYDQNLRPLARSNSNNSGTQVAFAGSAEGRYFLKLSGTNPQVDFDAIVTPDANPPAKPSWQNATNPLDANDDHFVTPNDALIVINLLNSLGAGDLASRHVPTTLLVDTNGDGTVSPLDALLVINHLNALSPAGADSPVPRAAAGSAGDASDSPAAMSGAIDQALGSLAASELTSAAFDPDLYDSPWPWSRPLGGRGRKPAKVNV